MAIISVHPKYGELLEDWQIMADVYAGQRVVKSKRTLYLPATTGMILDGMKTLDQPGYVSYSAYLSRARFPEVVKPSIEGMVGLMHRKPPEIELPAALEPLRENAGPRGESLEVLLRKINEQQLHQGRLGLLVDVPNGDSTVMPFISIYTAMSIRNWDDSPRETAEKRELQFVLLDQSGPVRGNEGSERFLWTEKTEYLLVSLENGVVTFDVMDSEAKSQNGPVTPSLGGFSLTSIPFVFINTLDLTPEPDYPPLLPLANEALALYRLDADYRQALFTQGQDTLVIIGAAQESSYRVGANASIILEEPTADAKFIGVDSTGLGEVRTAHENGYTKLAEMGSSVLRTRGGDAESGDALRIRIAARTASIVGIARAGAKGLEDALKFCAQLKGADPEQVSIVPNLDFSEDLFTAKELIDYATAKRMGAPVSWKTIHSILKQREVTEMDFEDELEQIAEEELEGIGGSTQPEPGPGPGGGTP